MSWGHGNIAAIGTASLNTYAGTNFKTSLSLNTVDAEVSVLKQNLRDYKTKIEKSNPGAFAGIPSLSGNTSRVCKINCAFSH